MTTQTTINVSELENWLDAQSDQLENWLDEQSNLSENERSKEIQDFLLDQIETLQNRGIINNDIVSELKWYFDLTEWYLA